MVFGTRATASGTGVCFTRDPSTGESGLYGEFLQNAQGEDVVAGIRHAEPIERMNELLPEAYAQLLETIAGSRRTTATCRTSSSRSRRGRSSCSRPGRRSDRGGGAPGGGGDGRGRLDLEGGSGRRGSIRRSSTSCLHPMIDPAARFRSSRRA
jgi:hypothetical protein